MKAQGQHGFTVMEMVVVIAVVGILAATSMAIFFSVSTYNNQFYQDEVKNTIRYARKLAVATGGYVQVAVTSTTITLKTRTPGGSCASPTLSNIMDPVNNTSGYVRTAPGSTTITYSADFPIYFNSVGQVFDASNCAISSGLITIGVTGMNNMTLYPQTGFIK